MKYIKTLIIILLTIQSFGQVKYPRVEKVATKDKLFSCRIDTYPMTIHLKHQELSSYKP